MTRVRVSRDGRVGRVVLARPEKKNALDRQMATELHEALHSLGSDAGVGVVLLAAEGPDFCAGADLEALEAMIGGDPRLHLDDAEALGRVFLDMREIEKPVVAAVRGRALAGGAGLATAADIVIAHEEAQFGYPEVRVGFVPAMVMTILRRLAGEKRAFELVATGRTVSAREALEIGLVSRVESEATFDSAVEGLLQQLAKAPPAAFRLTKRLFYSLDGMSFPNGIALGARTNAEARQTEDFARGVRRFVQRPREGGER